MATIWLIEAAGPDDVVAWLTERLSPYGVTLGEEGAPLGLCLCVSPWLALDDAEGAALHLAGDDVIEELSREFSARVVCFVEEDGTWRCTCAEAGAVTVSGEGSEEMAMEPDVWAALTQWFAPAEGSNAREPWLPLRAAASLDRILRGLGLRPQTHGESCRTLGVKRD